MHIPIYNRFIAGNSRNHLLKSLAKLSINKFKPIIDYAGENCKSKEVREEVHWMVKNIKQPTFIALKLSGLDLYDDISVKKYFREFHEYHLKYGHRFLIDAEDNKITPQINLISDWASKTFFNEQPIFYKTYQMYRKDELERLLGDYFSYNTMRIPHGVKLVRGAYLATEKNDGHLFNKKSHTDNSYNYALKNLTYLATINPRLHLLAATHNDESLNILQKGMREHGLIEVVKDDIARGKFPQLAAAQLYGMSDKKGKELIGEGINVYKYMPYGEIEKCLPYFVRRLHENLDIMKYIVK